MNLRRMLGALLVAMLASALVYAVLAVVGDGPDVAAALSSFPLGSLAVMFLLALGGHMVRGLRWGQLMRLVGDPVSTGDALYLHLSGQTMTISPGRVGEVLKPWLARELAGMPMSKGIALVFCERVADLLAVFLLSLGGLTLIGDQAWVAAVGLGAILAGIAVAGSDWFHRLALRVIMRQRWAREHRESADAISATIRRALAWGPVAWSTASSVVSWGLEGLAFYLCLGALGFDGLGAVSAVSVYAVSTIIGAFTFMPGGIGITEASIAGILVALGMAASAAAAATVITRVATLWWAVLLGWAVLASRPAIFKRLFAAR